MATDSTRGWDWHEALEAMPGRWTNAAAEIYPFAERLIREERRRVHDLGCGVGRHAVMLAGLGLEVTASDISSSAMRHAHAALEAAGVAAGLVRTDMSRPCFRNGAFDAVVAFNVVYHATRGAVESVLESVRDTLVDGGLLFLTLKSTRDSECGVGRSLGAFTWAPEHGVERGIPHYYADETEARRLLSNFELLELAHKQEPPASPGEDRVRAHWVIVARKPGPD